MAFSHFLKGCARLISRGNKAYWAWMGFLLVAIGVGLAGYVHQSRVGLIATNMRDQVS